MIDDYVETMELVERMKKYLPIPEYPTKEFIHCMKQNKVTFVQELLQIQDVLYLGDEGGIGCAIAMPSQTEKAVITSITHLRIKVDHPLVDEIEAYQKKRTRKLASGNLAGNLGSGHRIGRNSPCSCGSGKKYKKCCGKVK